jgi:hypothetical protein
MPLALSAKVWDEQITRHRGPDAFHYNTTTKLPEKGADGICELRVNLADEEVVRMAQVGGSGDPLENAVRQVYRGMTFADLGQRSPAGQLLLNDGFPESNYVNLPRLATPTDDSRRHELRTALLNVLGQPRVWMLYSPGESKGANLKVIGFVAARVMHCPTDSHEHAVVLQPCMLITATAVTDHTRRELGPRSIFNPTIARVRLVD